MGALDNPGLTHVSVSQIQSFQRCPRQHAFRYLEKRRPAFRSSPLPFGSAFHDVVGYALYRHGRGEPASREELRDHFRTVLRQQLRDGNAPIRFEEGETHATLLDQGLRMLDTFLERFPMPEKVLGIEVPFSVELEDPETGEFLDAPLVGSIDAIVANAGETSVLELKTAKRRWDKIKLANDIQPTAYGIAVRRLGHAGVDTKLVAVTKTHKPDVQISALTRNRQDERDFRAMAVGVVRASRAGVDYPQRSWACNGCGYREICR